MAFLDPVSVIDQKILVGLTYLDQDGNIKGQTQFFGNVLGLELQGLIILDQTGKNLQVPFIPAAIAYAPRGEYRLMSTGETVTNPDLITSWRIYLSQNPGDMPQWQPNYAPFHNYQVPTEWQLHPVDDEAYEQGLLRRFWQEYLDKTVLISLEYYSMEDGKPRLAERVEQFGKIIDLNIKDGITYQMADGTTKRLPPKLSWLEPAEPGSYTIRATGEVVENPDFISVWQVMKG